MPAQARVVRQHPDVLAGERGAALIDLRQHAVGFGQVEHRQAEHLPVDVAGMRIVGGLDVVLAGRPPRISGLVTRARRANRLVLVGRAGLKVDPLTTTWLLTGLGSGTRDTALSLLTRLQASPPLLTIGTSGAAVAPARQGLGVTQVHEEAVREQLDCGELASYAVTGTPLERPWQFCTTSEPTAATRLFLAHVCDPSQVGEAAFHIRHRPQGEYADV